MQSTGLKIVLILLVFIPFSHVYSQDVKSIESEIYVPGPPIIGKRKVKKFYYILRGLEKRKFENAAVTFHSKKKQTSIYLDIMNIESGFFIIKGSSWQANIGNGKVGIKLEEGKNESFFTLQENEHAHFFLIPSEKKLILTFQFKDYDNVPEPYRYLVEINHDFNDENSVKTADTTRENGVELTFSISQDFSGTLGIPYVFSFK